jgi:sec-independent protein translocase protein TatA
MDFLGIGGWEIFLIMIIAILIYGPGRIVEVARNLGKIVRTLKNATSNLTAQISKEMEEQEKVKAEKRTDDAKKVL